MQSQVQRSNHCATEPHYKGEELSWCLCANLLLYHLFFCYSEGLNAKHGFLWERFTTSYSLRLQAVYLLYQLLVSVLADRETATTSDQSTCIMFWVQELCKNMDPCLMVPPPPSDCIHAITDRFSGVRHISLAVVFRRRSRRGRYTMTTITTERPNARSPYNHGTVGATRECLRSICARDPGTELPRVSTWLLPLTTTKQK